MGFQKRESFIQRIQKNVQNVIENIYFKCVLLC
jgi:hypothetical protein